MTNPYPPITTHTHTTHSSSCTQSDMSVQSVPGYVKMCDVMFDNCRRWHHPQPPLCVPSETSQALKLKTKWVHCKALNCSLVCDMCKMNCSWFTCTPLCFWFCLSKLILSDFAHPDIMSVADWALKIKYLSIYLKLCKWVPVFRSLLKGKTENNIFSVSPYLVEFKLWMSVTYIDHIHPCIRFWGDCMWHVFMGDN